MKPGDKVWVLCEVDFVYTATSRIEVKYDGFEFSPMLSDCKPVEPETVEQKKSKAIFKVKGHDRRGTVGTITKTNGWLSLFESTDGKFLRWCYDFDFDLLDESGNRINKSVEPETVEQPTSDPVNPSHYKQGGIECIEAIKAALVDGFSDYLRGNVIKYLWRYKEKNGIEDLRKSAWYLDRLIEEVGE